MSTPARDAQIHDLGYRGYDGPRLGEWAVARALFVQGLRHAYGLGRSLKARVLPIGILLSSLVPALVSVAIVAMLKAPELPIGYQRYPMLMQMLTSIFVAAQAPVIFSRDLRYRTLTLYLARPMHRGTYVAARLASLFVAVLAVVALPVLILWLGAMLGGLDVGDQTRAAAHAVPGLLVLTTLLTVLGGLLSSLTTRRGIAVVSIIATLAMSAAVAGALSAIIQSSDGSPVIGAAMPALLNPYTLTDALQQWWFGVSDGIWTQITTGDGIAFVVAFAVYVVGGVALMMLRYAKAGAR